jgi:tetratricopeptide (TPR) repeat protein
VVCDVEPGPAGLSGRLVGRSALRSPPLWEFAAQADPGIAPAVLNWPCTHPAQASGLPAGVLVAPGVQSTQGATADAWGLHPDAVWPVCERAAVHAHRLHPDDLDAPILDELLHGVLPSQRRPLLDATRRQLAELSTLQALALRLGATAGSRLAALRLDTLADVAQTLASALRPVPGIDAGLQQPWHVLVGWMRFVDMLLAEQLATLAPDDGLLLVGSGALPAALRASRRGLVPEEPSGFVLLHGPGVRPDRLIDGAQAVDIAPTVLGWLGLSPPPGCQGRRLTESNRKHTPGQARPVPGAQGLRPLDPSDLLGDSAPDAAEADGLAWLAAQGVAPLPLDDWRAVTRQVQATQLLGLAQALLDGGRSADHAPAVRALRSAIALADSPTCALAAQGFQLLASHALAQQDLALVESLAIEAAPLLAAAPDWQDLMTGLLALAHRQWPEAEACFARLTARESLLVNAPACWGRALMAQGRLDEAERQLVAGLDWPVEQAATWAELGRLRLQRGDALGALQAWNGAVAWQPANPRWHAGRARALALAGDSEAAVQACWRTLQLDPDDTATRAALARLEIDRVERR